ncbi:histidine phosphatase family protein [Sphingorhabdus arenilitoris]|uniref:Histidine phosphatase family protein n=1 Tax=Sphingorhabdus arenilitoris TaxID=1490041 RepID=A0ABV8RKI4_9SPHN
MTISTNGKRLFIARHGETVYNLAGRMQGMNAHTPLTWQGCEQAAKMGEALRSHIADPDQLQLISSPSGRTLQTLALVAAGIHADWHSHSIDPRLREIDVGEWEGHYYADLFPDISELIDMEHKLFKQVAPGGEDYPAVEARLRDWISDQSFRQDMLIISHGMTARVLRALLLGLPILTGFGAPIARSLSQGTMVMICDGREEIVISGDGSGEKA